MCEHVREIERKRENMIDQQSSSRGDARQYLQFEWLTEAATAAHIQTNIHIVSRMQTHVEEHNATTILASSHATLIAATCRRGSHTARAVLKSKGIATCSSWRACARKRAPVCKGAKTERGTAASKDESTRTIWQPPSHVVTSRHQHISMRGNEAKCEERERYIIHVARRRD